tara:strand:- start:1898 stop:2155 length:258 start_codon:yes stop_codon:yes gene_type:complete
MTLETQLAGTDKMVRRVMDANASPIHIEIPSMPDPFKNHLDMAVLFDLSAYDWSKFFGAVLLCSFAAGMAWQGAIVGRDYLLPCP